jgi:NAD(P)-dependent dehydrogenase (short-subunit alcohol dehydrogenase family)
MPDPVFVPGATALVTGGAGGIGLAAALRFARLGLRVTIADSDTAALADAETRLAAAAPDGAAAILAVAADVSSAADLDRLKAAVTARFGSPDILMANAGIQPGSALFGPEDTWERVLAVNLWGPIRTVRAFVPEMIAARRPGRVIATGSKQGITTPPGDPAYNVSKAGLKAFTEALAHELRETPGSALTAHLLIPGFVFTGLTARGRTEKPAAAWTPDQTADFMLDRLAAGDFYILCPDNDVDRATDEKRIAWAAGDIIENRPALSRWHPDWTDAFAAHVAGDSQ